MKTIIDENQKVLTQITIFDVAPENMEPFMDMMITDAEVLGKYPGLVSISLHKSFDGSKAVNYVQFRDQDARDGFHSTPDFQALLGRVKSLVRSVQPLLYEVVYTCHEG